VAVTKRKRERERGRERVGGKREGNAVDATYPP